MVAWERLEDEEEGGEIQRPPYLENAERIATELSLRTAEMSSIDVTQCIWALGRLEIRDESLVCAFASRAKELVPVMNSVESSNVLWGLAKVRFKSRDSELVGALTDRLTSESLKVSPQEAASALYALGRLRFQDEQVYDRLSRIMINQINDASAQGIANALWAYRAVHLQPPKELLNLWATQKLGLVSAEFQKAYSDT
jgi:hypothetical protein